MLRTTFSKLKKACSSLAPRVLRGDTRASGKFQKFQNESSPILPRSFCKGDWTTPNLKATKVRLLESKGIMRALVKILKTTIARAFQRNAQVMPISTITVSESVVELEPTDAPKLKRIGNSNSILLPSILNQSPVKPEVIPYLNLRSLLLAPMAAVSYIVARPYSESKDDDIFWRPRFPSESFNDPKIKEAFGRDARYLLLSFDSTDDNKEKKNSSEEADKEVLAEPDVPTVLSKS